MSQRTATDGGGGESLQVVDILVVGGGPGGTATACRATELGLSVLVIDHDDLMRRIRDYSKDKLILPGFGGGDRMRFPLGGELVEALRFPPIDKDEMCATWKGLYQAHAIPYRLGVEFQGLEDEDGIFSVEAWDHKRQESLRLRARHVVLACGRGVPRRFDIPGNTEGIAFRLTEVQPYLGAPACVVGGGTSAAEAVIALSNAKAAAGDPSEVHWSYRGDKMPRVSKALAEVFFEAYVGNGNIRYHPRSEPAAIVTGDDRREYLSIRTDRRSIPGRPPETTQLEFLKEQCIACIGEDLPVALLEAVGAPLVVGGPKGKRRLVVSRCLETRRPRLYLVGDILSQAYFEVDSFGAEDADTDGVGANPASLREVKHRGNIKSALRDGVLVAQVIRQRLDGKAEVDVTVEEAPEEAPELAVAVSSARKPPARRRDSPVLVRLLPGGEPEEEYALPPSGVVSLGRRGCDLNFPEDELLADRHASLAISAAGAELRDEGGASGVFLRLPPAAKRPLEVGDLLRAGRQFLLVSEDGGHFVLQHYDAAGREVARYPLLGKTAVVGRQAPDITLDAGDRSLSRRHFALNVDGGQLLVRDLKSANGTELRVRDAVALQAGDRFRVGRQTFAFATGGDLLVEADERTSTGAISVVRTPAAQSPAAAASSAAPVAARPAASGRSSSEPTVTLSSGETFAVAPGQTLCEAAEAAGLTFNAECHSGICGSDPIRILKGLENVDGQPGPQECETLEDLCELQPGACRLACMVRLKGSVTVERL